MSLRRGIISTSFPAVVLRGEWACIFAMITWNGILLTLALPAVGKGECLAGAEGGGW